MISILTEHFDRQAERNKKRSDEDYDDGVEEQLVDEDDEVGLNESSFQGSAKRSVSAARLRRYRLSTPVLCLLTCRKIDNWRH